MKYSPQQLRTLRNEIPIDSVISKALELPFKHREGYLRFLCPLCREFHTATNPRTNLARCFRCHESFNPIDLVMIVEGWSFRQAVDYLMRLRSRMCRSAARPADSRGS